MTKAAKAQNTKRVKNTEFQLWDTKVTKYASMGNGFISLAFNFLWNVFKISWQYLGSFFFFFQK